MKIRNILALVALSCMLVLTGCKKEKGGIPDHLKIIPANSIGVMTINAKELVEKGGLDSYKDFELYKKFHQEIARYEPEATKLIDEFLKDTRVTGLNLDQVFMYVQQLGRYNELTAFTLGVDNADKVEKWFTKLSKLDEYNEYEISKGNGYSYLRLDRRNLLVWDKTKAIFFNDLRESDEEDIPSFESLLNVDEAHSIVSNPDFMESYNAQKDFTFWFSFKKIAEINDSEDFNELTKIWGEEWKDASMDFAFNFTNEKAAFSASIWPMSLAEKFKKEYPVLKSEFDESLLRYLPQTFLATVKASFNIQEYYKVIVDKLTTITKDLEGQEDDDDDYYSYNPLTNYDYMSQLLSIVSSEQTAKIVNSFKGDIIGSIFGFQEGIIPVPYFGIAVTIDGEQAFNYLMGLLPKEIALTKTDSYYSYNIPQVMTLYAGQKGDVMYITNSKEAIDNFYAQGYKDNLGSSSIAANIKNSPILYSINADLSSYPALVTTMLRQSMGSMEYSMFASFLEPFSSMNLLQTATNSMELNLMLKSNKENSLKVIFKETDRTATKAMGF